MFAGIYFFAICDGREFRQINPSQTFKEHRVVIK